MNRNSGFRWVFGILLLLLIGMLYWSSTLVEKDLKLLQQQMEEIRRDINEMRLDSQRFRLEFPSKSFSSASSESPSSRRPHIDARYPNLLEEDPFYAKTLPHLIGSQF